MGVILCTVYKQCSLSLKRVHKKKKINRENTQNVKHTDTESKQLQSESLTTQQNDS